MDIFSSLTEVSLLLLEENVALDLIVIVKAHLLILASHTSFIWLIFKAYATLRMYSNCIKISQMELV